jgi:hypothetical protein
MITRRAAVAMACICLSGGSAVAVDLPESMYYPYAITGYAEFSFGLHGAIEDGTYPGGSWSESWGGGQFLGSARTALEVTPEFSIQGDAQFGAWLGSASVSDTFDGNYSVDYTNIDAGVAGHLSWRPQPGVLIGLMGSFGAVSDWGGLGTLAVEGEIGNELWRLYGQAGAMAGVTSEAAEDSARLLYAHGVLTYYVDPNFSLSGNLGVNAFSDDDDGGTHSTGVIWGGRLDYKPEALPFSLFVGYQGWAWAGSDGDGDEWQGLEHAAVAGFRVPFDGEMTLREQDQRVGLYDLNPEYGAVFVR